MHSSQHPLPTLTNASGRQPPDSNGDLAEPQDNEGSREFQRGEDLSGLGAGEWKAAKERVVTSDIGVEGIGGYSSQRGEGGEGIERGRMSHASGVRGDEATAATGAAAAATAAAAEGDGKRWYTVNPERGILLPGEKLELRLTVLVSNLHANPSPDPNPYPMA